MSTVPRISIYSDWVNRRSCSAYWCIFGTNKCIQYYVKRSPTMCGIVCLVLIQILYNFKSCLITGLQQSMYVNAAQLATSVVYDIYVIFSIFFRRYCV